MLDLYESYIYVLRKISDRKIMNSIQKECTESKQKYDACYSVWFTDQFLKGNSKEDACAALFASYQQCLKKAMKEHNIHPKEIESDSFEIEKKKIPSSSKSEL